MKSNNKISPKHVSANGRQEMARVIVSSGDLHKPVPNFGCNASPKGLVKTIGLQTSQRSWALRLQHAWYKDCEMSKKILVGSSLLALAGISLAVVFALDAGRAHKDAANVFPQAPVRPVAVSSVSDVVKAPAPTVAPPQDIKVVVAAPIPSQPAVTAQGNSNVVQLEPVFVVQEAVSPSVAPLAQVVPRGPAPARQTAPQQRPNPIAQQVAMVQEPDIVAMAQTRSEPQKEIVAPSAAFVPKREVETLTVTAPRVQQVARVDIDTIGRGNSLTIQLPRKNSAKN
jgi:hypothetical protein